MDNILGIYLKKPSLYMGKAEKLNDLTNDLFADFLYASNFFTGIDLKTDRTKYSFSKASKRSAWFLVASIAALLVFSEISEIQ